MQTRTVPRYTLSASGQLLGPEKTVAAQQVSQSQCPGALTLCEISGLALRLKEVAQQDSGAPLVDPAVDFRPVIATRPVEDARPVLDAAALGIVCREID